MSGRAKSAKGQCCTQRDNVIRKGTMSYAKRRCCTRAECAKCVVQDVTNERGNICNGSVAKYLSKAPSGGWGERWIIQCPVHADEQSECTAAERVQPRKPVSPQSPRWRCCYSDVGKQMTEIKRRQKTQSGARREVHANGVRIRIRER